MNNTEGSRSSIRHRGNELFIPIVLEGICAMGIMIIIVMGFEYRDSFPNALWIASATAFLLLGFTFDRGAISTYLPSIVRERVWWVGPSLLTGLLLMQLLIEGNLFGQTLADFGLFVAIAFGFWMMGTGLKRLVVRGRLEQAYRGMVAKTGERRFGLNRRLLIGTVGFMAFIDLFAFIFDYEYLPRTLSASLFFLIFVNMCVPAISENPKAQNTRMTESDE